MPKDSYFRIYKNIFKLSHVLHVCLALIFASREEHHRDCCKSFKGRKDPFGAKNGSAPLEEEWHSIVSMGSLTDKVF